MQLLSFPFYCSMRPSFAGVVEQLTPLAAEAQQQEAAGAAAGGGGGLFGRMFAGGHGHAHGQ